MWTGWPFGWPDVGVGDVGFAMLLSVLAVASLNGLSTFDQHAGASASVFVLLLTAPVAFARRNPLGTTAVLAAGGALNWLLFDHFVRCGAALPAVFYAAFVVGSRSKRWTALVAGAALLTANVLCQSFSDPELRPSVIIYMVPIVMAFVVAGRLLWARSTAVVALRARTVELREQREQTARLAVAADHALIAEDLDGYLHDRVSEIAEAAAAGRAALASSPDQARESFFSIQDSGRETLTHMRAVVAGLQADSSTEPQPVLAQLDRLLAQLPSAEARLTVTGDPRMLPPGVELSGYRIVEHLLLALENSPTARVAVAVAFTPGTLELTVAGPAARRGSSRPALAAAAERAATLGGTLRTYAGHGRQARDGGAASAG
ncbi:hypothetical protein CVV68_21280 [Arthrobacter livingstonensis]|uniref:histidine kinase n=1 Tax=Arthrobacter livingstonensis TaxID=670078 RepID=A0A2V5L0R9_9MICC|nr:hypothetical protein CVV68_21280 [Arthrobacter livingstonensis]